MTNEKYLNFLLMVGGGSKYQDILNQATADGVTLPSEEQQSNQRTLFGSLVSIGVMDKFDAFWCFANDGSSDFATYNWKNPSTFKADVTTTSPTFTSDIGFNGNGTSSYIDLNIDPTDSSVTKYTRDDASFGVYSWDDIDTAANNYPISQETRIRIFQNSASDNNRINSAAPTSTTAISTSGTGLIGLTRGDASEFYGLSSDGNYSSAMAADSVVVSQTGNFVLNKFDTTFKSGRIGMAWVGGHLTATEWSNFVTAVNTYINTL
jgi:hypothetical protein